MFGILNRLFNRKKKISLGDFKFEYEYDNNRFQIKPVNSNGKVEFDIRVITTNGRDVSRRVTCFHKLCNSLFVNLEPGERVEKIIINGNTIEL